MEENKKYLTIHGHFYQPPRENPWLEEIEIQDSAKPYHNWNSRISAECYEPNAMSRIVDGGNKILNIVNNYELMSFNFGPTLLSWMQKYAKNAYKKILMADKNSQKRFSGHSCAMAQVYNHIIMPLANARDKETQIVWGIKDYESRFGHKPEGIWLAETAVDEETLEALVKQGIKFTVLSPFQAQCIKKIEGNEWYDVSWGSIDPSMPYRYYIKGSEDNKYIDLFFYDGTISKSVAFDNLLMDGQKFANRLNDGYNPARGRAQLVNIATDGESYGHHTKFGDMALSYVLSVKAKELGFEITNYGEFLEKFPPTYQVEIKPESSWSCCHGVGRWQEDCGCSTGGQLGWNQRWRAPLRKALDDLRNELIIICQIEGDKLFHNFWHARNNYIDVILDRSRENVENFLEMYSKKKLNQKEKIKALKLLEIQRQAMLMYTSCGWFFSEISGIETVQIMKYAARAIELAKDFTDLDLEKKFVATLSKATSNIKEYGDGKNIYEKFVKKSIVSIKQIVGHYAISSIFVDFSELEEIYCYKLKKINYKKIKKDDAVLVFGRVEVTSEITFEKWDMSFALTATGDGETCCVVQETDKIENMPKIKKEMEKTFFGSKNIDVMQTFKEYFANECFTLKEVLIDRRKTLLSKIMEQRLAGLGQTYKDVYQNLKGSVGHLIDLGLDVPEVFRLAAKYTISTNLEEILQKEEIFNKKEFIEKLTKLKTQADKFNLNLGKTNASSILNKKLTFSLLELTETFDINQAKEILAIFKAVDILGLDINIRSSQNIYFEKIYKKLNIIIEHIETSSDKNKDRELALTLLDIGKCLNINTDFFMPHLDKACLPNRKSI